MAANTSRADRDRRFYAPCLDAGCGLENHWYPGLFSHGIADCEVKGIRIAGAPILLRRAKGKVHALLDRCVHREVKLSLHPTCLMFSPSILRTAAWFRSWPRPTTRSSTR